MTTRKIRLVGDPPFLPSTTFGEAFRTQVTKRFQRLRSPVQSRAFNVELSSALDIYFKNLCRTCKGTDRPVWKSSGRQNKKKLAAKCSKQKLCLYKWQDFVIPNCESPTSDGCLKTHLSFEGNLLGDCWLLNWILCWVSTRLREGRLTWGKMAVKPTLGSEVAVSTAKEVCLETELEKNVRFTCIFH